MSDAVVTDRDPGPWWLPWALGMGTMLVYALTAQRQLFNDGIFFEHMLRLGGESLLNNHILYLPLVKTLQLAVSTVVTIDGEQAMKLLSAIAGGIGVGLTYVVARECVESVGRAVASALLLATLVGPWFHATVTELHSLHSACTTVLLLALFRTLHRRRLASIRSCLFLAFAVLLTPASHVSGICVLLPLAYVWWQAGPARTRFLLSAGGGAVLFGAVYLGIMANNPGFAGYTTAHTGKHGVLWEDPARIPFLLQGCASEFLLYSAPAAALIPAGLRVLFRTAPRYAWFSLCWLLAWPLIAWPVEDRAVGSYYTATFPVQALLAIVAMHSLGRTGGRALLVAALAILPLPIFVFAEDQGLPHELVALGSLAVVAIVLARLAGGETRSPRGIWWLPLLAFVTTAPHIINVQRLDPRRDRITEVAAVVTDADQKSGKRSLVIYLAIDTSTNHHWKHFFPGAYGDESRAFNPVELAFQFDPAQVGPTYLRFQSILRTALAEDRPVFLEGSREIAMGVANSNLDLKRFLGEIIETTEMVPLEAENLWRLTPRR